MKQSDSPVNSNAHENEKKNIEPKKLGDKIGPARKGDQQVDDQKDPMEDQESTKRSDKNEVGR